MHKKIANDAKLGRKIDSWFYEIVDALELRECVARRYLYETPEFWPQVAELLDEEEFERARPRLISVKGDSAAQQKNFGLALQHYNEALELDSHFNTALIGKANVYRHLKETDQAIPCYEQAIHNGEGDPMAYNNLAWYRAEKGDASWDLLALAQYAVDFVPVACCWDTLAYVYLQMEHFEEAKWAAEEAIKEDSENESYLARMEEILGKSPKSLASELSDDEVVYDDGSGLCLSDDASMAFSGPIDSGLSLDDPIEEASSSNELLESDDDFLTLGDESMEDDGSQVIDLDDAEYPSDASAFPMADMGEVALDSASIDNGGIGEVDSYPAACAAPLRSPTPRRPSLMERLLKNRSAKGREKPTKTSHENPVESSTESGDYSDEANLSRDVVDCSIFAPKDASVGSHVIIQVFAHLREQSSEAAALAVQFDEDASLRGKKALATEIARGSTLTFQLRAPQLEVADDMEELVWRGGAESVQFEAFVPELPPGNVIGVVTISQNSVPIGRIRFVIKISTCPVAPPPYSEFPDQCQDEHAVSEAVRFQKAFISYASADRTEVLHRVQMLRAVGIKCFQDVLELDPGDRWERELYRHIDESDVIFLFWSQAAKASAWVEKEWRYGLKQGGDEMIQPIPIELPVVPPPDELSHLHFDDKVLYFFKN